jgi:uncharacterized membrane protein
MVDFDDRQCAAFQGQKAMADIILAWISALLRWTHLVAGIAWIGSSFYFIAADLNLRPNPALPPGVKGETWQVHGGGFYHIEKYLVAPHHLPTELTWFKWEAYSTWIFGFLLLVATYYLNPTLYLIDAEVAPLLPWQAVAISLGSLALGWILYDLICRSSLGRSTVTLTFAVAVLLAIASEGYLRLFGGRAAFLHIGALIGSLMVGNVFFIIIPNQKKTVATLLAGGVPDPRFGAQAKQRSLHNNYLTLPVLFLMVSNHYPMSFGPGQARLTLAGLFLAGFLVRHFFNMKHAGERPHPWLWPAAGSVMAGVIAVSLPWSGHAGRTVATLAEVQPIIAARCVTCHAAMPSFAGLTEAPKGIRLETAEEIIAHAAEIREQVVVQRAMPMGNLTQITEQERAVIAAWVAGGAQ